MTDPTAQARELAREIRALPFSPYYPKIDRAQALCTAALLAVEQRVWEEVISYAEQCKIAEQCSIGADTRGALLAFHKISAWCQAQQAQGRATHE